jgi:protein SCO1/2
MTHRINLLLIALLAMVMASACDSGLKAIMPSTPTRCLPDLNLTDQNGQTVNLASLKGSPLLFDFIYTSCPGPCELMTQRMGKVADQLGLSFGSKVRFVSVTMDPEHDRPPKMLAYAKALGANRPGWLFLTGTPAQIEQVMSAFKVEWARQPDGSIDHVLAFFLVDSAGNLKGQYSSSHTRPEQIAEDIARFINHG